MKCCHPYSLPGGVYYPARRGLAAGGAAPAEARGGEGAGNWEEGGAGFQHEYHRKERKGRKDK